jgi:hypothetical protein
VDKAGDRVKDSRRWIEVADAVSVPAEIGEPVLSVEWAPAEQAKAGNVMRLN